MLQYWYIKDPSQPLLFSMASQLLILHGEVKSFCLTVSCVPESVLLSYFK